MGSGSFVAFLVGKPGGRAKLSGANMLDAIIEAAALSSLGATGGPRNKRRRTTAFFFLSRFLFKRSATLPHAGKVYPYDTRARRPELPRPEPSFTGASEMVSRQSISPETASAQQTRFPTGNSIPPAVSLSGQNGSAERFVFPCYPAHTRMDLQQNTSGRTASRDRGSYQLLFENPPLCLLVGVRGTT